MTKYKSKFTGQQIDDGIEYGVRVTQQTFSSAQKQQARENIGAQETVTDMSKLGSGIGTCSTSSGTALTVSLSDYNLVTNGIVMITFENDVPAGATLNINSKGAKSIYYKGAVITADTIKAGDMVTMAYDGTNYIVQSIGGESGGGSSAGLEIVAASGTTLNAEVGKYYTLSNVGTLAITLPTIPSGTSSVQTVKFYIEAGASPSVSFTSSHTIIYQSGWTIIHKLSYELSATWNGGRWIIDETPFGYNWINIKTKSTGGNDAALTVITEKSSNDILYLDVIDNKYWDNGIIKIQYNPTNYSGWCIFAMKNVIYNDVEKTSGSLIANWGFGLNINYYVYY